MAGGWTYAPRRALAVAGAAVLLCSVGALSACSGTPAKKTVPVGATTSSPTATTRPADKAAADKAAADQNAAVKAAAKRFLAQQKAGEAAASRAHPVAKAAAACGVPLAYVFAAPTGSRIGIPDVPRSGDIWRVRPTSPVKPGLIIYWPDGGSVLCR